MQNISSLVGRILITLIFLKVAFDKIMNFGSTSAWIGGAGLPLPEVFTVLAIAIEILCGIALVVGFQARWAALILFLYLVPVTYLFHNAFTNPEQELQMLKNLAIMGGLLMVTSFGAGKLAVDKK